MCLWLLEQGWINLARIFYLTHHIHLTLLYLTTTYFCLDRTHSKKNCIDLEDLKKYIKTFFTLKPAKFYADGIYRLPDSWTKVIDNNKSYSTEKNLLKRFLSL